MGSNRQLKEDPDVVFVNDEPVASVATSIDSIPFIIYSLDEDDAEPKIIFRDPNNRYHNQFHQSIRRILKNKGYDDGDWFEIVQGRLWPIQKISSIYQEKAYVVKYKTLFQHMFDELGLKPEEFQWDWLEREREDASLEPWPGTTQKVKDIKSLSKEQKKELASLIAQLHMAVGAKKQQIRNQIKNLQQETGVSMDQLDAAVQSGIDQLAKREKEYGSVAAANFYKGSIAEEKVRIYNKTLNPVLWDGENLRPEVRLVLIKIAKEFYNGDEMKYPLFDILLLGSAANYNWTPESDIDLHLLIDVPNEKELRPVLNALGSKWNQSHDIHIKNHKVEVYLQDKDETNRATGIYSLIKNEWILKPQHQKLDVDKEKVKQKYQLFKDKIQAAIDKKDPTELKSIMKELKDFREKGLSESGEFSEENITFKALRHTGELTKLKNAITKNFDKSLSIDEAKDKSIWVGFVNSALKVVGKEVGGGLSGDNHESLAKKWNINRRNWVSWRYRSDINTIYWWTKPTEEQKTEVEYWIADRTGNINIKNNLDPKGDDLLRAHGMLETKNRYGDYLYIGLVSPDLEIKAIKDFTASKSHKDMNVSSQWGIHWRYKSSTNTIFWWEDPTDEQESIVEDYLYDEEGITNPKSIKVSQSGQTLYLGAGHELEETQ
jgi:predicted nucleotidyltransferase